MPAMNTAGQPALGPLPALQVIAGTTETQIVNPQNPALALTVVIPPNQFPMEQARFDFIASGYIKTVASGTVTVKVYSGTSTTIGSNTLLGTSGAITQNTSTAPWWAHANLIYDSVSGLLCGTIEFYVNKTSVGLVTLSNFPTSINNTNQNGAPVASFTLTFTSTAAGATINVQRMSVG